MTVTGRLQIQGLEQFLEQLYTDWSDPKNTFSDPRTRAVSCTLVIENLILQKRTQDAHALFNECKLKNAWSAEIGVDRLFTANPARITRICQNNFEAVQRALQTLSISLKQ